MKKKLKEFLWKISEEGLGYCLESYFSSDISDEVNDLELINLWRQASEAVLALSDYIEPLLEELEDE